MPFSIKTEQKLPVSWLDFKKRWNKRFCLFAFVGVSLESIYIPSIFKKHIGELWVGSRYWWALLRKKTYAETLDEECFHIWSYRTVRMRIIPCEKEGSKSLREKEENLVLTSLKRKSRGIRRKISLKLLKLGCHGWGLRASIGPVYSL